MTDWSRIPDNLDSVLARLSDPALAPIGQKIMEGRRLGLEDGLASLQTTDLVGLGSLAHAVKQARFGNRVSYVVNHHLNYTNVCINGCRFCAFSRPCGSPEGYLLSPEDAAHEVRASGVSGLREVHLVGAINPEPEFGYYTALLQALKKALPGVALKAFTAVEIDHIAKRAGLSWRDALSALKECGLDALPGGGAEVFSERVRKALFPSKISSEEWLAIHAQAHRLGIGTNATLLFGHVESYAERIEHLIRLRAQQDESGGFRAFIPLVFHPGNTSIAELPGPDGMDILKTIATSRLMLDNFAHVKAYWVTLGKKVAQTALHFGADDLDGTIVRENITHQAGAQTARGMTRHELDRLIMESGFDPLQRDTFHEPVRAA